MTGMYWRLVLVFLVAVDVWFLSQVWQNVSILTTRTLPGLGHASELLDRAADLEFARLSGILGPAQDSAFRNTLALYEGTIAVERDRINWGHVKRAYATYLEIQDRESWLRLRREIKTLHSFRLQRAQTFASDSYDSFSAALGFNVVGLVSFSALLWIWALLYALYRRGEKRPDDF